MPTSNLRRKNGPNGPGACRPIWLGIRQLILPWWLLRRPLALMLLLCRTTGRPASQCVARERISKRSMGQQQKKLRAASRRASHSGELHAVIGQHLGGHHSRELHAGKFGVQGLRSSDRPGGVWVNRVVHQAHFRVCWGRGPSSRAGGVPQPADGPTDCFGSAGCRRGSEPARCGAATGGCPSDQNTSQAQYTASSNREEPPVLVSVPKRKRRASIRVRKCVCVVCACACLYVCLHACICAMCMRVRIYA